VQDIPIFLDSEDLSDHQKHQIEYFKKESEERGAYKLEEWQKSYIRRFDENFNINKNDILVDIGAGSGYIAVEMAKRGAYVIACDLTFASLLKLNKTVSNLKIRNKVLLICCDAQYLSIKSKIVDFITSNAVLEHLSKEKEAIREIDRVSRKDTGLMITVPLKYKYLHPLFMLINYIHDKRIGHLRRYDKDEIKQKFQNWEEISCYYTGHMIKVIKVMTNRFVKLFNEKDIEKKDNKKENIRSGSSNICMFFRKKASI
jgi:ubiquinone/menaquinone biosynthesis C-methylase UbiE